MVVCDVEDDTVILTFPCEVHVADLLLYLYSRSPNGSTDTLARVVHDRIEHGAGVIHMSREARQDSRADQSDT